jgi:hypothetical protein
MNQAQTETIQAWARSQGVAKVKQKTIEELAELIRSLATGSVVDVASELADVKIMILQLETVMRNEVDTFAAMVLGGIAGKVNRIEQMLEGKLTLSSVGLNIGHGHVFPRADGLRAMCEGPPMCSECSKDQERKAEVEAILADEVAG